MKKSFLKILLILFPISPAYNQLPEKPEDISPLLISEKIPEASLLAPDGSKHALADIIKDKPTVILFYRGGWCPFCNSHLGDIHSVESEIPELGYQLIAISPDSPENLQGSVEKHELNYSLYSDASGELIKEMGIAYQAPEKYVDFLKKSSGGANEGFLPVPSVFVVNTKGEIVFQYINPNYKVRISSGLLLAILKNLGN